MHEHNRIRNGNMHTVESDSMFLLHAVKSDSKCARGWVEKGENEYAHRETWFVPNVFLFSHKPKIATCQQTRKTKSATFKCCYVSCNCLADSGYVALSTRSEKYVVASNEGRMVTLAVIHANPGLWIPWHKLKHKNQQHRMWVRTGCVRSYMATRLTAVNSWLSPCLGALSNREGIRRGAPRAKQTIHGGSRGIEVNIHGVEHVALPPRRISRNRT